MSSIYVFDNKDHYTDASATDSSSTSSFILTSAPAHGRLTKDVTVVEGPNGKQASINWKDEAFDIDGQTISIDNLRFKDRKSGMSLLVRRWSYNKTSWHVKYEYRTKTWHVWKLVDDVAEERTAMEFNLYKSKIMGSSVPATIVMNTPLSDSDTLFLWMAVIYSELTEHPRPSFTRNLGDNIARAITAAASTIQFS